MRILPINTAVYNRKKNNFNGNHRIIKNDDGALLYKTSTFFFRIDFEWDKFVKFLGKKYKDVPKVTIINHACSNGTEAYCLAAKIMDIYKDKADKFLPIEARDIDENNIKLAVSGNLEADIYELTDLKNELGERYSEYFEVKTFPKKLDMMKNGDSYLINMGNDELNKEVKTKRLVVPKPILKDKVKFKQSDIFEDIDTMPRSNTVLMCRNFWPYLSAEKREELAKKIVEHFDDSCLIVTGNFDRRSPNSYALFELFRRNGIVQTEIQNVWQVKKS